VVTITDVSITVPFVKVVHPVNTDEEDSLNITQCRGLCRIYNSEGKLVPSAWFNDYYAQGNPWERPMDTERFASASWDYKHYSTGFVIGEPIPVQGVFTIQEYSEPKTLAHMLARFKELTAYDFDGFCFNLRTHSVPKEQHKYGFNPAVREKCLQRYGFDIWKGEMDLPKWLTVRGEGIADFFKGCKAMTNGRPIFLDGWIPTPAGERPRHSGQYRCAHLENVDLVPLLYERFLADKSIDGVNMCSGDFADKLRAIPGGENIRIGYFRDNFYKNYDVASDLEACRANPEVTEVQLYETLNYTHSPGKLLEIKKVMVP